MKTEEDPEITGFSPMRNSPYMMVHFVGKRDEKLVSICGVGPKVETGIWVPNKGPVGCHDCKSMQRSAPWDYPLTAREP